MSSAKGRWAGGSYHYVGNYRHIGRSHMRDFYLHSALGELENVSDEKEDLRRQYEYPSEEDDEYDDYADTDSESIDACKETMLEVDHANGCDPDEEHEDFYIIYADDDWEDWELELEVEDNMSTSLSNQCWSETDWDWDSINPVEPRKPSYAEVLKGRSVATVLQA